MDAIDDTGETAPVRNVRRMTGAEVERVRRSGSPLLTTGERGMCFACPPSRVAVSEVILLPHRFASHGPRDAALLLHPL